MEGSIANAPSARPQESILEKTRHLRPEELRAAVREYTAVDLEQLIREMDAAREVPEVFRRPEVRDTISQRCAELGIRLETRQKWQELQGRIEGQEGRLQTTNYKLQTGKEGGEEEKGGIDRALDAVLPANLTQGQKRAIGWATAGLAVIAGIALLRWMFAKDEAEKSGGGFWKGVAIFGGALLLGGGITYYALKDRILGGAKGVAAGAKDAADKATEKGKEAAERVDPNLLERKRDELILAGLLFMHGDLAEQAHLTQQTDKQAVAGVLGRSEIREECPVGRFMKVRSAEEAGSLFRNPPPIEAEKKAVHFLALICEKYKGSVQEALRREGSERNVEEISLEEFLRHIGQVGRLFQRMGDAVREWGGITDISIEGLMEKAMDPKETLEDIQEDLSFMKRLEEEDPRLKNRGVELASFCAAHSTVLLRNALANPRNIPNFEKYGANGPLFIEALRNIDEDIKEATPYLLRYTHGKPEFQAALEEYLRSSLTIFDAFQLYAYLHQVRHPETDELPESIRESGALPAFLLQMKVLDIVGKKESTLGKQMKLFLLKEGTTSLDVPEGMKELLKNAGNIATGAAWRLAQDMGRDALEWLDAADKTSPFSVRSALAVGGYLAYRKVRGWAEYRQLRFISNTKRGPWYIRTIYGVTDPDRIREIQKAASDALGKRGHGRLERLLSGPGEMRTGIAEVRKLVDTDPTVVMRNTIRELHLKAARLGADAQEFLQKNPNVTPENFYKNTPEGKRIGQELAEINGKISKASTEYLPNIVKSVSGGQVTEFAKLSSEQKLKVLDILKKTGKEIPIRGAASGLVQAVKGRIVIMAPLVAFQVLTMDKGGSAELHKELASTGASLVPVVGTCLDFKAAISGTDAITGKEVSRLSSLGWGIVGLGCDVGTLFFGAGAAARVVLRGGRGGARIARMARRVDRALTLTEQGAKTAKYIRRGATGAGYALGASGMFFFKPEPVASIPDVPEE